MKLKKLLSFALATVSVLSLSACGDKQDAKDPHEHVWGEWERVTAPTCETVGKKKRTCTLDETHTEEADIVALQHDFGNQGICNVCEKPVVLPEEEANPTFIDPLDLKENKTNVTGDPFYWYKCGEGYYEFTINSVEKPKETWVTFSVKEAGQYALYSIENEKGVTVERFDASAHYIPIDDNGNYIGFAGRTLENGNFISTVNCSKQYFNSEWRATFRLSGKTGSIVKLRFVKVAEPLWQPTYLYTTVNATEINGKKAPDAQEGYIPVEVPYTAEYFFDETVGYYRLGNKDNPGEIIYVPITATASRLLSTSFVGAEQAGGNNLAMLYKTDADGNYVMHNYADMIALNFDESNKDNCYQNFVNKDGYYPLTKELQTFLTYYVKKNPPVEADTTEDKFWLSACYTYAEKEKGTEDNPYPIEQAGSYEITTKAFDSVYYKVQYGNYAVCTLSWEGNIVIKINDEVITSGAEITIDSAMGTLLEIYENDGAKATFTLTITDKAVEE